MNIISSSQCVRLSRLCSGSSCVTMSKLGLHSSPVLAKKVNIIKDLRKLKESPQPALVLGISGLIPFASAPVYMINSGFLLPDIVTAQLAYGAVILSFLGGVRWGMLVNGGDKLPPSWPQYTWAVTPSLLAWTSILLSPETGVTVCALSLALTAALDIIQPGYPRWFRGLRFLLTSGAVFSLLATLYCIKNLGTDKHASDFLT